MLPSRFSNIRPLGTGGFATVSVASDSELGEIAIKSPLSVTGDVFNRFRREVELQGDLSHPNIVDVLDFDLQGTHPWYAMTMAEGNLAEIARQDVVDDATILSMFQDVLSGIGHAHAQHILHRDLKPGNILIYRDGVHLTAKVADFGLSRRFTRGRMDFQTQTEYAAGTNFYTAPEQWNEFKDVTETADVYSLGRILEFLVATRDSLGRLFPQVRDCTRVATRSDPLERYQTVEQLAVAIGLAAVPADNGVAPREALINAARAYMLAPEESIAVDRLMDALEKLGPGAGSFGVAVARVPEEAVRALCVQHPGRLRSVLLELLTRDVTPEPVDAALRARNFLDGCSEYAVDDDLVGVAVFGLLHLASIYQMSEFVDVALHHFYKVADGRGASMLRALITKDPELARWVLENAHEAKMMTDRGAE